MATATCTRHTVPAAAATTTTIATRLTTNRSRKW
jgi:hypothetical protein